MIFSEKYVEWIREQRESDLNMISVGYYPVEKERILHQGYFDMGNQITDISFFSKLFSQVAEKYFGNEYKVRLIDTKYSFLPKFIPQENPDILLIKNYLNKIVWKHEQYFGEFIIKNILEFLEIFLNYPVKYNYQDILLFPIEKDYVIQISHHGSIWLSSSSKDSLKVIGYELDKEGATVIYGKDFNTV